MVMAARRTKNKKEFDPLIEAGIQSKHVPLTDERLERIRKARARRAAAIRLEQRIREALAEPEETLTLKQFQAKMRKIAHEKAKLPPVKKKQPRCKQVLVVLDNRLEVVELLREEMYPPPPSDFPDDGLSEFAVVRYQNLVVHMPIECVVFLVGGIASLDTVSQLLSAADRTIDSFKMGLTAKRLKRR